MHTLAFTASVWLLNLLFTWGWPPPAQVPAEKRVNPPQVKAENPVPDSGKLELNAQETKPTAKGPKLKPISPARPAATIGPKVALPVQNLKNDSSVTFQDSVLVVLPDLRADITVPQVYKLRLTGRVGTEFVFRDYRVILDSTNEAAVSPSKLNPNDRFQQAHWQLLFNNDTSLGSAKAVHLNDLKSAATMKPASVDLFWQNLAYIGSALIGLYGLLWAASRYLNFSVRVKPAEAVPLNPPLPATGIVPVPTTEMTREGEKKEAWFPNQVNHAAQPDRSSQAFSGNVPTEANPTPTTQAAPAGAYFFTELLLTAGPRKKYMSEPEADKDLGEDVCGLVADHHQLLLWVLDGTSDQYCLRHPVDKKEYFSSRLLAQSVANKLRMSFNQLATSALDQILNQAIAEIKTDWLGRLQLLPPEEQAILRTNIVNKNIPECATTLLFGTLNLAGDLMAYRSGDCKMVLYTHQHPNQPALLETPLLAKNDASNDRLFFRLILNPAGELDILHNTSKFEIIQHHQVHALAAFSDGIGLETEARLRELADKSLLVMREEIIYQLQGTADDKAICFVEIRQAEAPFPAL